MPIYEVELTQLRTEHARMRIEAQSESHAIQTACANPADVVDEWRRGETIDDSLHATATEVRAASAYTHRP